MSAAPYSIEDHLKWIAAGAAYAEVALALTRHQGHLVSSGDTEESAEWWARHTALSQDLHEAMKRFEALRKPKALRALRKTFPPHGGRQSRLSGWTPGLFDPTLRVACIAADFGSRALGASIDPRHLELLRSADRALDEVFRRPDRLLPQLGDTFGQYGEPELAATLSAAHAEIKERIRKMCDEAAGATGDPSAQIELVRARDAEIRASEREQIAKWLEGFSLEDGAALAADLRENGVGPTS